MDTGSSYNRRKYAGQFSFLPKYFSSLAGTNWSLKLPTGLEPQPQPGLAYTWFGMILKLQMEMYLLAEVKKTKQFVPML